MTDADILVERLRKLGNPADLEGMRRFGVGGIGTPSARWIAADALRELRSDGVLRRITRR